MTHPDHDTPSLCRYLRTPGVGSLWGPSRFDEAADALEAQRAELDRLKEALRFYATPNNYCRSSMFINSTAYSAIDRDEGAKARDAMGETTK